MGGAHPFLSSKSVRCTIQLTLLVNHFRTQLKQTLADAKVAFEENRLQLEEIIKHVSYALHAHTTSRKHAFKVSFSCKVKWDMHAW